MADNLGQGFVEVIPDFSSFDRQLAAGIDAAFARLVTGAQGVGEDIERAFEEAARGADEALADIGGASLEGIGEAAQREGEQVERAFDEAARQSDRSLSRISGTIGLIGGAIAAAGLGAGFGFAINQASDLNESMNAVAVTFGENAEGINAIGESANTALGLTQSQFNGVAVQFSSFADKIAGDGGDVVGTIDELATRGADFASVMNLEVADALAVFQSGLAGETEPLKKFGIDLSEAAVKTFAVENGIAAVGEELTETQKVQARYGALMEQTNKVSGDFANTSDSLANGLRILKATATEAAASFGSALLPGLQGVVGGANEMAAGLTAPLEALGASVGEAIVPLFDAIGPALSVLVNNITGIVEDLAPVFGALGPLISPIVQVLGVLARVVSGALSRAFVALAPVIETIAKFLDVFAEVIGEALFDALDALAPALDVVGAVLNDVLAAVLPILISLVRALAPILSAVAKVFADTLAGVLPIVGEALASIATALEPIIPLLGEALMSAFEALAPLLPVLVEHFAEMTVIFADLLVALIPILEPLLQLITLLLDKAIAPAIEAIAFALEGLSGVLRFIVDVVAGFVEEVVGWFTTLFNILVGNSIIPDLIGAIIEWFTGLPGAILGALASMVADIGGVFIDLATAALDPVAGLVEDVVDLFTGLPGQLLELLGSVGDAATELGGAIIDGFLDGLVGIVDVAGDLTAALGGVFADVWNSFIDIVNAGVPDKIDIPGPFDINLPNAPFSFLKLAEGALFQSTPGGTPVLLSNGIPAIVGEGRRDEAVLPLPDGVIEGLQRIADGGAQGGTWNIYETTDARDTARRIGDELRVLELLGAA